MKSLLLFLFVIPVFNLALISCEQKSDAEKVADEISEAIEEVADGVGDAIEEVN